MTLPLHRLAGHLAGAVSLATAATMLPSAAEATAWPGHPDRSIVRHAVRPGETATGLAVRYHAWTDELIRLNRLGSRATLYRGQVLRIPVVVSAVRRARGHTTPRRRHHHQRHHGHHHKHRAHHVKPLLRHSITPLSRTWLHADLTREQVRHLVSRMAHLYKVPRTLHVVDEIARTPTGKADYGWARGIIGE